jgi:hypothetical protein
VLNYFRELNLFLVATVNSTILVLELSHFMILLAILLQCSAIFAILLSHFMFCYNELSYFCYNVQSSLINSVILAALFSHF